MFSGRLIATLTLTSPLSDITTAIRFFVLRKYRAESRESFPTVRHVHERVSFLPQQLIVDVHPRQAIVNLQSADPDSHRAHRVNLLALVVAGLAYLPTDLTPPVRRVDLTAALLEDVAHRFLNPHSSTTALYSSSEGNGLLGNCSHQEKAHEKISVCLRC